MDMRYFARICAHAQSWREFAECRFAHFPSFFSVHVDTYAQCVEYWARAHALTPEVNPTTESIW